jgi:hypothetical protein
MTPILRAWWFTQNTPSGMLASMLEASPKEDEKDAIRVNQKPAAIESGLDILPFSLYNLINRSVN